MNCDGKVVGGPVKSVPDNDGGKKKDCSSPKEINEHLLNFLVGATVALAFVGIGMVLVGATGLFIYTSDTFGLPIGLVVGAIEFIIVAGIFSVILNLAED